MNTVAQQTPAIQAIAEVFALALAKNNEAIETSLTRVCARFAELAGNLTTATAVSQQQQATPTKSCSMNGSCKGTCDDCKHQTSTVLGAQGDAWTSLVTTMQSRGCGLICRPLHPCFVWALQMMLTRVSLRRLYWMLERDDDSAEINQFVGNGADFVNINTTAMVSNKKSLLAMTPAQLLPLIPAVSKATATWVGDPVVTNVTLTLYQGAKGLTNLSLADLNTQLLPLGQPKNLSRWFCTAPNGQDGNCFVRPWPPFLGCSGSIIPDTEAVYLLIETGVLGDSQLQGLSFEVIKAGTMDAKKYCKSCEVATDEFGMPVALGQWA
jgi:hypothetical protein